MNSTITGTPENFEIVSHIKKVPLVIPFVLITLALIFFSIPFVIIVSTGFSPRIIFGFVLVSAVSFWLIKTSLWNLYGIETITYNNDVFTQQYDYKYFKSNPITFPGVLMQVEIGTPVIKENENLQTIDDAEIEYATVDFLIGEKSVSSTLPVNVKEFTSFFQIA